MELQGRWTSDRVDDSYSASAPHVALILKGGGVKGLAVIGAILELKSYYEFDWFVGTSAGSIVAVLLGAGYTAEELKDILIKTDFKTLITDPPWKMIRNLIRKGGLYDGRRFMKWIDNLVAEKIPRHEVSK